MKTKPTRPGKNIENWRVARNKRTKVVIKHADGTTEIKRSREIAKAGGTGKRATWRARLAAHYQSAYWKKIRLEALERDDHRCRHCRATKRLDVHHLTYARLGAERLDDLQTLCRSCHEMVHLAHRVAARERRARKRNR